MVQNKVMGEIISGGFYPLLYLGIMKKILFIIILNILLLMLAAYNSFAQHGNNGWRGSKYHYGTYYTSPQEGRYGERKAVRTERDARKVLLKHFSSGRETIGEIRDRNLFF
jgi:hypothetical protein